jgi:hypothetical protein
VAAVTAGGSRLDRRERAEAVQRVGSKGYNCARLAVRKKICITGEKAVELITARSGGELRTARRKGDWRGREGRRGGQRARGRLRTTGDATGSGGIVEVGGCRSAPLSKQRGERESEQGRRRSAREEEKMEGGELADVGPRRCGSGSHGVGTNRGAAAKTGEGRH